MKTNKFNEYSYEDLRDKALARDATRIDVDTLGQPADAFHCVPPRPSGIIYTKVDGAMLEQIISILMEMDPEKLRVVLAFLRAYR